MLHIQADFLIIGSGIAALRAAVAVATAGDVVVLTKAEPRESNTGYAQGGIAAVLPGSHDTPALHAADTIAAGDGLCDEEAVRILVEEGGRYVLELIEWGARFDRAADGTVALTVEGGHSRRRVLHAQDATGQELARVLGSRVGALQAVRVVEHAHVTSLVLREGACVGARFRLQDGTRGLAMAPATLLATGGAGQVFQETTNPAVATGDGIVMAYCAGARVADLEFVQFHPTALDVPEAPRFLLSEALRGEGALLINSAGEPFMGRYDPAAELAPRDRVARAILQERARTGGPVYLTLQHLPSEYVHGRFPLISAACRRAGLDLARDRIPVGPAAHYVMGGVETDLDGRTSVPGLFAAGEVACTRVHGANRLASNSLLEGLVFGARAGHGMRVWRERRAGSSWPFVPPADSLLGGQLCASGETEVPGPGPVSTPFRVPELMWRSAGVFREGPALAAAVRALDRRWHALDHRRDGEGTVELDDEGRLVGVGRLIARAALRRCESRGAHYRADFPARDDVHWKVHLAERQDEGRN